MMALCDNLRCGETVLQQALDRFDTLLGYKDIGNGSSSARSMLTANLRCGETVLQQALDRYSAIWKAAFSDLFFEIKIKFYFYPLDQELDPLKV